MKPLVLALALSLLLTNPIHAQSSRLDRILAVKQIRVCIWPDYYGISYRNPKTQQLSGIGIDLAGELAKDLGVQLRFEDSSFAKLIDDVIQDRCDIAIFAIGITPARLEKLRFTRPHLISDIYAITTKSNRRIKEWADIDKPGVVVAVAKGTYHEEVMREKLKAATLLVTATPQGREQEVESGRADVFMTDYPFSRRMLETTDWARLIRTALDRNGANPLRLKLELTESLLLEDVEGIISKMGDLKAMGVGFALDDFGTGYSSLSYLKRLPLDQLKIDRSFVHDVLTDPNDAAIAGTIVALGRSLGLSVIAEGVEEQAQRDLLAEKGCHAYQGYLFGRPVAAEAFPDFLKKPRNTEK